MEKTELYALGSNGSGQLGLGHDEDVSGPTLVALPAGVAQHHIEQITAGGNHTLILTEAGDVYASGSNAGNRCGLGINKNCSLSFQRVRLSYEAVQNITVDMCAATWDASVFVTSYGILVCGTGSKGELGLGKGIITASEPALIEGFPPEDTDVVHIVACMGHVVAVLSNGDVYGWGTGRHGQLGQPQEDVWSPRKVEGIPFRASGAVCGKDFTCVYSHPDEGHFMLLGPGKRDRFNVRESVPRVLPGWKNICASWGSILALMPSGEVLGWGRNDHGQLPPPNVPKLRAIHAGSEHILAFDHIGQVLTWGWGEHGNCAQPVDDQSDVKGRWNTLKSPSTGSISLIAAGCATSFFATSQAQGPT